MIVATQLPANGILSTGATFAADVNLIVQLAMGGALIVGGILAKQKRYGAHGTWQTTVLLFDLWMIGFEMWPSFRLQIAPHVPRVFHTAYYAIAQSIPLWAQQLNCWEYISRLWRQLNWSLRHCASDSGSAGCE